MIVPLLKIEGGPIMEMIDYLQFKLCCYQSKAIGKQQQLYVQIFQTDIQMVMPAAIFC